MGRSVTPTYRLEIREFPQADGRRFTVTPMTWSIKSYGYPTDANLARAVHSYEHQGPQIWKGETHPLPQRLVSSAKIVRQSNGETVATYMGPAFAVVGESRTKRRTADRAARRRGAR